MATFTKVKLSGAGSKNAPIEDMYYSTANFTFAHSTGTSSTVLDEVWLYLTNNTSSVTVESIRVIVDGKIIFWRPLEAYETVLVLAGIPFSGNGSSSTDIYFGGTNSGGVYAYGYANRITP